MSENINNNDSQQGRRAQLAGAGDALRNATREKADNGWGKYATTSQFGDVTSKKPLLERAKQRLGMGKVKKQKNLTPAQKQKQVKKMKKASRKFGKKFIAKPFRAYNIRKRKAEMQASDNPAVALAKHKFDANTDKMRKTQEKINRSNSYNSVKKGTKQLETQQQQQQSVADLLKASMAADDLKNMVSGPAGCAKSCRNNMTFCLCGLLAGGGIICAILSSIGII